MYNIGLSTNGKEVTEALFKAYKESGIKYAEISPDYNHTDYDFESAARAAKAYGVELWSYHLPFGPFEELDPSVPELAEKTKSLFYELIKKAAAVGIDKAVIHPSGEPIDDVDRPERMKCAKNTLAELGVLAKKEGVILAVEDLPRSCLGKNSDEISELISLNPDLRVCFDTNHLLGEPIKDFIKKVGDKIVTTHISDYDFVNERHWLPGEGKIDWNELVSALAEVGYDGAWMYEIGFWCPNTILRDRNLTCADFARNAEEVLQNKKITVISKPKPNLGMWE